jgi:Uma2 family endonuclease
MSAPHHVPPGEIIGSADQRVVMRGVPWSSYEALLRVRGDAPAPRVVYLDGTMELMSPSKDHERIKSYLGRLVEAYALECGIDLSPYGSWTLRAQLKAAGIEPDECYILGSDQSADVPDLAIEVVWTSGGLDKLEAYARLGVAEVWTWKDDAVHVHVLRDHAYTVAARSPTFPDLDLGFMCSLLDHPTVLQAVRALREHLAAGG